VQESAAPWSGCPGGQPSLLRPYGWSWAVLESRVRAPMRNGWADQSFPCAGRRAADQWTTMRPPPAVISNLWKRAVRILPTGTGVRLVRSRPLWQRQNDVSSAHAAARRTTAASRTPAAA